jgi:ferrous iron transport protein A
MNPDETSTQRMVHKPLTSIISGKVCRLVGVSEEGWGFKKKSWFDSGRRHGHWGGKRQSRAKHRPIFGGGHWKPERQITRRLLDLGLTRGCTFKVVQGNRFGPVLIEVRGTRIALGHGLARRVIVEEAAAQC